MILRNTLSVKEQQEQKMKENYINEHIEVIYLAINSNDINYLLKIFIELFGDTILRKIDTPLLTRFLFQETTSLRKTLFFTIQSLLHEENHREEYLLEGNLERLSTIYIDNHCKAIKHLVSSLIEEFSHTKTSNKQENYEIIRNIIIKQLHLHNLLFYIQHHFTDDNIIHNEIERNQNELEAVKKITHNDNAEILLSSSQLYNIQPSLRQIISSNNLLIIDDVHYRKKCNDMNGSSHSLYTPLLPKKDNFYSPLRDYTFFIEAVSCFCYEGYATTFGFLHTIQCINGSNYQIEYPVMLIDSKIFNLKSVYIDKILLFENTFQFNHDLWHHLIPVYADHFIIQHPDAPISYGGYLKSYQDFAQKMRKSKEEYEIGLGICQRNLIGNYISQDSENNEEGPMGLFKEHIKNLYLLIEEQKNNPEISSIMFHLLINCCNRFLTLFSFSQLQQINNERENNIDNLLKIIGNESFLIKSIDSIEVLKNTGIIRSEEKIEDQIIEFKKEQHTNTLYKLLTSLEELGTIQNNNPTDKTLHGIDIMRWFSVIYPQRKSIRGYTERIQSNHIVFDNQYIDATELLSRQYESILNDFSTYNLRAYLRNKYQYFTHRFGKIISQVFESESKKYFSTISKILDKKITLLLRNESIRFTEQEIRQTIIKKKLFVRTFGERFYEGLYNLIIDYNQTIFQAEKYMLSMGISFKEEKKKILKNLMSL